MVVDNRIASIWLDVDRGLSADEGGTRCLHQEEGTGLDEKLYGCHHDAGDDVSGGDDDDDDASERQRGDESLGDPRGSHGAGDSRMNDGDGEVDAVYGRARDHGHGHGRLLSNSHAHWFFDCGATCDLHGLHGGLGDAAHPAAGGGDDPDRALDAPVRCLL